jgi:NitT/TauT family transport system substrate-binding protein
MSALHPLPLRRRSCSWLLAAVLLVPAATLAAGPSFIFQPARKAGAWLDSLEVEQVRIAHQYGLGYLPLLVMRQHRLIEKYTGNFGLGNVKVTWNRYPSGEAMNAALQAGLVDFGSGGAVPLIRAWDQTREGVGVKGVASLGTMPVYMVANDASIKSVKDLNPGDRIALPSVKTSLQAVLLQMAAARAFGMEHYAKLDALTVPMAHPDGLRALLAGKITAQVGGPPFQDQALRNPGIHRVWSSYRLLGGPATYNALWTTGEFRSRYPKTYRAVYLALREALDIIRKDPAYAADIYLQQSNSPLSPEFVTSVISNPEVSFTAAPQNVETLALFMYRTDAIRNAPAGWRDLFFDDLASDFPQLDEAPTP